MDTKDMIDVRKLAKILWKTKLESLIMVAICIGIAVAFSLRQPIEYEATSTVQINVLGSSSTSTGYIGDYISLGNNVYLLNSWKEIMESLAAGESGHVSVSVIKNTDLIKISGRGNTPEEAVHSINNAIEKFCDYQLETSKVNLAKQEAILKRTADQMKNDLEGQQNTADINAEVKRKAVEENYVFLYKELKNNTIRKDLPPVDVQVITPAVLPTAPLPGKSSEYVLLGFLAGCLLSLLLAVRKYHIEVGR